DAGELQRHLGDAERADQRAVVDVAEMADAEVFAGVLAEARPVGDVERVERQCPELVGVVALRQQDRRDGRRQLAGVLVQVFETPGLHRATRRFGQALMRSEEHTSELQSPCNLVCRLLLEKKKYYF